jgi:hypothetical protein
MWVRLKSLRFEERDFEYLALTTSKWFAMQLLMHKIQRRYKRRFPCGNGKGKLKTKAIVLNAILSN